MSSGKACSGIIGRDKKGTFLMGSSSKFFANSALVAEATAIREAITLASGLRVPSVIIESYCLVAIEMCRGNSVRREIEQIVNDILKLKSQFTLVGFTWTKRYGNSVADLIANLDLRDLLSNGWIFNPPVSIRVLMEENTAGIGRSSP